MAYNTIAGYRTAISEIHEWIDDVTVGSHPDITWAMKAIFLENPPPIHSDDPINIIPSLDYIKSLGDNDSVY